MARLQSILDGVKLAIESDTLLASFATALKKDEPGSAGRFVVRKANEFLSREVPLNFYPFVFIVLGDEIGQDYDAPGRQVTRQFDFHFAFFDNNADRGTDRAITLETIMVQVLGRHFSRLIVGPNNPTGLIRDYEIGLILSDRDVNRPKVFRSMTAELVYTSG